MYLNIKFWKNKNVLVTGHTGFKGGWLSILLKTLNSKLSGYSLNPVSKENFFNSTKIKKIFKYDFRKNIIDFKSLKKSLEKIKPEIIFHLAAQPSVIESFKNPKKTILTNIIGTSNLLEAAKDIKSIKCIIIITTDKVYQNYKFHRFFSEKSILGGDDIYSGSKACCELLVNSYNKSFFFDKNLRVATARAGNCFGGGDWTKDRIVKDALESFFINKNLVLRSPNSNRPWQHVIEPLVGYLKLAEKLYYNKGKKFAGPWNFGPSKKQNLKVIDFAKLIKKIMNSRSKIITASKDMTLKKKGLKIFESKYLNIDSRKARKYLNWYPKLSITDSIHLTFEWHKSYKKNKNMFEYTKKQIIQYLKS